MPKIFKVNFVSEVKTQFSTEVVYVYSVIRHQTSGTPNRWLQMIVKIGGIIVHRKAGFPDPLRVP
jgi:hypothetical protein